MSEKASKGSVLGLDQLQNHTNEGERKEKKERARRNKGGIKQRSHS